MSCYESAESILRLEFLTMSPIEGYRDYHERCISDSLFLSNSLHSIRENSEREWNALYQQEGGTVEGSFGIFRHMQEYSHLYELVRDPLIDLASAKEGTKIENISDAVNILDKNGYHNLTKPIVPQLRHGPAHFSIQFDDENGQVNIYDKRTRKRSLKMQVSYEEALDIYLKMRDLIIAVLNAMVLTEEMLVFEYLRSRDFMFRVIENAEVGAFS